MRYNVNRISDKHNFIITGVSYAGKPKSNTMMYITKKVEYLLDNLHDVKECLIFLENEMDVSNDIQCANCVVFSNNPQLSYAHYANEIANEENTSEQLNRCENGYYLGQNVTIGKKSYIEPNVVIGSDCIIGENVKILTGAVIKNAVIGDNCLINENAVIGSNGFTMAEDESGNKIRIPSLGKVIIRNNVEVGVADNISRGSAGDTVIEDSVKIDALVHIGHDVHLNANTEITAGAVIGGFVETGEKAYIGINSVVRNRKVLGKGAFVGMGAVVTKSVDDGITVVGNPARELLKG